MVSGYAQPRDKREESARSDWQRQAEADKQCIYHIKKNNQLVSVADLAKDKQKPFETDDELKQFFKEHLFPESTNQETLCTQALYQLYQAGLPHATNSAIDQIAKSKNISFPDRGGVNREITFEPSDEGLIITEKNTYLTWMRNDGTGKRECEKEDKAYYAQTKSTYLMKHDGTCVLKDLEVDCPSSHLAPIFDIRPTEDQPLRIGGYSQHSIFKSVTGMTFREFVVAFMNALFQRNEQFAEDSQKSDIEIYRPH